MLVFLDIYFGLITMGIRYTDLCFQGHRLVDDQMGYDENVLEGAKENTHLSIDFLIFSRKTTR